MVVMTTNNAVIVAILLFFSKIDVMCFVQKPSLPFQSPRQDMHEFRNEHRFFGTGHLTHYGVTNILFSKSKNSAGGSAAVSKKIQVKLLKYVAGTGLAGEIVQVTPAFFQNKLRPTKSAVMITDEEVQKEIAEAAVQEMKRNSEAIEWKEKVEDMVISISRKAGPDGHLFGGIGPKILMDELMKNVDKNEFFEQKGVKIVSVVDSDGKELKGDIKHLGEFGALLSLTKEINAKVAISVHPEK